MGHKQIFKISTRWTIFWKYAYINIDTHICVCVYKIFVDKYSRIITTGGSFLMCQKISLQRYKLESHVVAQIGSCKS